MTYLLTLLLLCSGLAFAQESDETRFLQSHKTVGSPFLLPVHIAESGAISFSTKGHAFVMTPVTHVGLKWKNTNFVEPIYSEVPEFREIDKSLRWIEVKERGWEAGLGLASQVSQGIFTLGVAPYKGSSLKTIRLRSSDDEGSRLPVWPARLSELNFWSVGDQGTYQVFGGIQLLAGVTLGFINVANVNIGMQNQFLLEMRKLSSRKVVFRLIEENVKKRIYDLGPMVAKATLSKFSGKRLILEFMLDLTVQEHHKYYAQALRGNVAYVQKNLNHEEQRLAWEGEDRNLYFGVPWIWGRSKNYGHYVLDEDGEDNELSVDANKNHGILSPDRHLQRMAYQTDEGMVMYWLGEMNRTTKRRLEKGFLNYARALNLEGLDMDIPSKVKIGSVLTHLGLGLTREELMSINEVPLQELNRLMKERCEAAELKCRKERIRNRILDQVANLLGKSWKNIRKDLGILMLREPALLHALITARGMKKLVYFKFLSESYQSLEGAAAVAP